MHQSVTKLNIRFAALVMVALLLVSLIPTAAAAQSGGCGNGVSWSLSSGKLTISGTGAMYNYGETNLAPWMEYADTIRSITVGDGVTNVGSFAFFQLKNVTAVTLSSTVRDVGSYAFYGCTGLAILDLGGVKSIGQSAFELCTGLKALRLPSSLETLRFHAFYRCEGLRSVTIPASVTTMESTVFAYCTGLQSAVVLANIQELPHWTFYGCNELKSVSMTAKITSVGAEAFQDCTALTDAAYGGTGETAQQIQQQIQQQVQPENGKLENFFPGQEPASGTTTGSSSVSTKWENETLTTTNRTQSTDTNSTVYTEVVSNQTATGSSSSVVVDAVLESASGWESAEKAYADAEQKFPSGAKVEKAEVNIYLKNEPTIAGADLARFAGKEVKLNIYTAQGAIWHINGQDLSADKLAGSYRLSYTLKSLSDKNEAQSEIMADADAFTLVLDSLLDFKVEIELPIGIRYALKKAVFFAPQEKGGYERMQAVVVDRAGVAHFYLGYVSPDTEYLIGINVGTAEVPGDSYEDAIIPDTLEDMYSELEYIKPIEYVITGRTSSWGMDVGQVTWIMVGVLVTVVAIVGVVMFMLNKRRLKNGYVPEWDEEDDE